MLMSTCDSEHVPCEVHFHILRFVLCWGVFVILLGHWSLEILAPYHHPTRRLHDSIQNYPKCTERHVQSA
jgi:hypothetical protein